jgi:hypothetical protein
MSRFQIRIGGYDPRDLLHGHYLQYRYEFNWQGPHSCGGAAADAWVLDPVCCLCLTRVGKTGFDPAVSQVECDATQTGRCDGVLRARSVLPPLVYFVPESNARELQTALGSRSFALEIACGLDRTPAVRELLVDGVPWRDALSRDVEPGN